MVYVSPCTMGTHKANTNTMFAQNQSLFRHSATLKNQGSHYLAYGRLLSWMTFFYYYLYRLCQDAEIRPDCWVLLKLRDLFTDIFTDVFSPSLADTVIDSQSCIRSRLSPTDERSQPGVLNVLQGYLGV